MSYVLAFVALAGLAGLHELVRRRAARSQRAPIAIAVATVAHYIAIALLVFAGVLALGVPTGRSSVVVTDVLPGFDAAGKLKAGDRIVAVNGVSVAGRSVRDLVGDQGEVVHLAVERGTSRVDVDLQPRPQNGRWLLGVRLQPELELARDVGVATRIAIEAPVSGPVELVRSMHLVASDEADPGGPKRIVEEVVVAGAPWRGALQALVYVAGIALLVQLVFDLIRWRRAR